MITENKYCKCCGQKLSIGGLFNFMSKSYVEIDGEFYCLTCGTALVKKRRGNLK